MQGMPLRLSRCYTRQGLAGHAVHTAWALAVDVVEVYVPGPHLLVVTQAPASVAMLEVEAAALNLPLPQLAQVGDAVQLPTTEV